ncbi:unnamed protein product [Gongylonema pulchrum]|uniref:Rubis-subs-bind domain-containing protein n=1 Tax=Gongylonema pulchrum TaxID=637853 RepID=A0A183E5M8_9BILA|nr:unnamed protein product [Gongylonema pulchrum]
MEDEFSTENIQLLLKKAVTVLAAHLGADHSSVHVVTRIVAMKVKRMCRNLRLSQQRRNNRTETAFPSALMHALQLENFRNVLDLEKFYRMRIVAYQRRLLALCAQKYAEAVKTFAECKGNEEANKQTTESEPQQSPPA